MESLDSLVSGFLIAASVAIIGAVIGASLSSKYDRERRKTETSLDFIKEFFSNDFVYCRESLWWTKEAVLDNEVSVKHIARAFVYPVKEGYYYDGKLVGHFLEVQHLIVYFGFLERLGISIKRGYVNLDEIKDGLSNIMIWNGELVSKICDAIEEMSTEKDLHYIENIRLVYETLDLCSISNVYGHEIPNSCIELKESEKHD